MNKNIVFENYLLDLLYSLDGKISKKEFKQIAKFYQWKFNFKSIHIVGTNGKGSNAKYINDELIANGYKVGLFTSPHIFTMYERIKINDRNIDFESMVKFVSKLKSDFININFGWFDIFFLTAVNWFNSIGDLDFAIFEAGIGAKKDVVNFINHNYLLITSIGLDHQKILGKTIEKISIDKSHAIKKNVKVFISDSIEKKAISIFKNKANIENCSIKIIKTIKDTYETKNKSFSKEFLKSEFNIKQFKSFFSLPPGRSQRIIINNIECYLDVAHNVQGVQESINYYKKNNIHFDQVVVSLSEDKDFEQIINIIEDEYKIVFVYENKGKKPLKLFRYNERFAKVLNLDFFIKKIDTRTLFIGSFYLISEIFEKIGKEDYSKLF